jgi:hypothetical protein
MKTIYSFAVAATLLCGPVFTLPPALAGPIAVAKKAFALDLLESEYADENFFKLNAHIDPREREARNQRVLEALAAPHETNLSLESATGTPRRETLDRRAAEELQSHLVNHPVAGPKATHARDGSTGVGFCFGRAYYVHLEALRYFRVNRDMIRKIWAIGTLQGSSVTWSYHVATMIKAQDSGWWVIDSFLGLQKADQWMAKVRSQLNSRKHDVSFLVTQASRFTPFMNRPYTKGDLDDSAGYYLGFFNDLRDYERSHPHGPVQP